MKLRDYEVKYKKQGEWIDEGDSLSTAVLHIEGIVAYFDRYT